MGQKHDCKDSATFDITSHKKYAVIKNILVTTISDEACAMS